MEPCTVERAIGADLLKKAGQSIECFVTFQGDLIPCRWNGTLNGAAVLVRISDGRVCNAPVVFTQIVFASEVAAQCEAARTARQAEVQRAQVFAMQRGRGYAYSQGTRHYTGNGYR